MAFERLRTLGGALGSYSRKIIGWAISTGTSIGETLGIIKPIAPAVEPVAAAREWGQVRLREEQSAEIYALRPDQSVPRELFTESNIPWRTPIAYTVSIYGRASGREPGRAKRGQFIAQEFSVTVSRPLTVGEVTEEAMRLVGAQEAYPLMEIFSAKVVAAELRVGEEWRW